MTGRVLDPGSGLYREDADETLDPGSTPYREDEEGRMIPGSKEYRGKSVPKYGREVEKKPSNI